VDWLGSNGTKAGLGNRLKSDKVPRRLLATSDEAVELDVYGADHEYDEALNEEQVEENDDAV